MAAPNRSSLLTKSHRVLKKHYKPIPPIERPALEHLLFALCLENAPYAAADKAFLNLSTGFFDWNEVRVSTSKELAEVMSMLPDPVASATNVKRALFSIFESSYSFELDTLKKQSLGQATTRLKKMQGVTPFAISYLTQVTLGGHAIPVDRGALDVLFIVGAVTEAEMERHLVPGLERAIPKSKGPEFGSLLHQFGAELVASPYSPNLHKILLEIAPDSKDRLPKRVTKKAKPAPPPPPPAKPVAKGKQPPPKAKPAPAKAAEPVAKGKKKAASLQRRKPR